VFNFDCNCLTSTTSHSRGDLGFCYTRLLSTGRNLLRVFDEQRQTARCRDPAVYPAWTRKGFYWTRMINNKGSRKVWRVKNSSCPWLWFQQILCAPTRLLGLGKIKTDISWWRYKTWRRRSSGHKIWSVIDDFQGHHFKTGQEARNGEKLWRARRDRLSTWHVHFSRMPIETDWEDEAQIDVKYQNCSLWHKAWVCALSSYGSRYIYVAISCGCGTKSKVLHNTRNYWPLGLLKGTVNRGGGGTLIYLDLYTLRTVCHPINSQTKIIVLMI
jgi:hypothetical protein